LFFFNILDTSLDEPAQIGSYEVHDLQYDNITEQWLNVTSQPASDVLHPLNELVSYIVVQFNHTN